MPSIPHPSAKRMHLRDGSVSDGKHPSLTLPARKCITRIFARFAVVLILSLVGCGPTPGSLSGTVTVNGQPLTEGQITLYPVEGTATTQGGPIADGAFELKRIPPGLWRVLVSSPPQAELVTHRDGTQTVKLLSSPNQVSPRAKGNQRVIHVTPGQQVLDFALHNPASPSQQ